jgi:hypothetical protein
MHITPHEVVADFQLSPSEREMKNITPPRSLRLCGELTFKLSDILLYAICLLCVACCMSCVVCGLLSDDRLQMPEVSGQKTEVRNWNSASGSSGHTPTPRWEGGKIGRQMSVFSFFNQLIQPCQQINHTFPQPFTPLILLHLPLSNLLLYALRPMPYALCSMRYAPCPQPVITDIVDWLIS